MGLKTQIPRCLLVGWIIVMGLTPAAAEVAEVHWSLRPLTKPTVPSSTAAHPIDAFVDAKLSENGLARAGVGKRRTLIRRLFFGLTGLPPTWKDVKTFVEDDNPQSYEKLLEQLLASPRYGEHWARHWLDVAQYADTHGNDHDYIRPNAWPYRDYVIRSLNDDKPYARFVQEQVAGDALFPDSPAAIAALGFLAAGPWDDTLMATIREDTVDHRMGQNLDRDGMVSAVMGTFQSLTVHCARCHDHKFDPVSQREYYALQAVFAGVDRADRPLGADPEIETRRKDLRDRKEAIAKREPALLATLQEPDVMAKVAAVTQAFDRREARWKMLDVASVTSTQAPVGTVFTHEADGSWFVSGERPDKDTFVVSAPTTLTGIHMLRLEVLPDRRLPAGGPGRYDNGNFHLAGLGVEVAPAGDGVAACTRPKAIALAEVVADHSDGADAVANTLDSDSNTYWSIHPQYNQRHEAIFSFAEPLGFEDGTDLTISLEFTGKSGHQIGRFRLSISTEQLGENAQLLQPFPTEIAKLLRIDEANRSQKQRQDLALRVLDRETDRELAALPAPQLVYAATNDFKPNGSFKPASRPRPIHLLVRGDINQPGELVGPGALSCISGLPATLPLPRDEEESDRRAALAHWLTDSRNVLTWRSIVNRVWHYHFGNGLCDTPNDFGTMGDEPSHPELLDWLAVWFRDEARGSLKALHRLIVTSGTYRQRVHDATASAAARVNGDNRLLWRMNRVRLMGEQVRDAALVFSGRLDSRLGGKPAMHFMHRGDATFNPGGAPPFVDYANFDQDSEANARRAVYRFVFRTVPDPLMEALDCPDGGGPVPARSASSTAQQALAMLNDAFLIRQAEHIADRIMAENAGANAGAQIKAAFRILLQREPTSDEEETFVSYMKHHGLHNACHVLFNSNEFIYLD